MGRKTEEKMRTYHRYLGFFLAGIMAMYAISGIILIFRDTDFLKKEVAVEKTIKPNIKAEDVGKALKIKHFKVEKEEGGTVYFEGGTYDSQTGFTTYTQKNLPYVLGKMTKIHKATSSQPLFFLNIFFGAALLFFVISAFWMFRPSAPIFKKGIYFALGGLVLTLILLFV
ncbi:hypothetical protein [Zobellia alginiliquefaciens]|uniref:hypothetical protein n=1 Tax=Zobellia alginiliquefaciens TaxID=3032586 RepID=UPI0023E298E2|nr:hypothetical protein [Zobellia alginiliquefaciens]